MSLRLRRRVLRWGNGYGIRLTKTEAERLGVRPGSEVDVKVQTAPVADEVKGLPAYALGGRYDIDAVIEEELDAGR